MQKNKNNQPDDEIEPLSPEQMREIKRRVADLDDPIRYAIFSDVGGRGKIRMRLWLDVESDCYGMDIEQATLFKRERIAMAVAKACSRGHSKLWIAKITIKNETRKVLKYEKGGPE